MTFDEYTKSISLLSRNFPLCRYLFFKISLFNVLNEASARIFILIQFLGSLWNKGLSAQISSLPSQIKGCLAKKEKHGHDKVTLTFNVCIVLYKPVLKMKIDKIDYT